jgi:hypothetical protein
VRGWIPSLDRCFVRSESSLRRIRISSGTIDYAVCDVPCSKLARRYAGLDCAILVAQAREIPKEQLGRRSRRS